MRCTLKSEEHVRRRQCHRHVVGATWSEWQEWSGQEFPLRTETPGYETQIDPDLVDPVGYSAAIS